MANFQVIAENGKVQLNDTDPVASLIRTFTVNGEVNNENPLLFALEPSTTANTDILHAKDDPYRPRRFKGMGEVHVFDLRPTATPTKLGLEIYDAAGKLTYSSNRRTLNILDAVTIDDIRNNLSFTNGRPKYWSKNYGAKKVAVVFSKQSYFGNSGNIVTSAVFLSNGELCIGFNTDHRDPEAAKYLIPYWELDFLVIDVTGY